MCNNSFSIICFLIFSTSVCNSFIKISLKCCDSRKIFFILTFLNKAAHSDYYGFFNERKLTWNLPLNVVCVLCLCLLVRVRQCLQPHSDLLQLLLVAAHLQRHGNRSEGTTGHLLSFSHQLLHRKTEKTEKNFNGIYFAFESIFLVSF